jgi:hypothetical protein
MKYLPNKILSGNDASGDSVAESVEFDLFMTFEVFLAQKNVEVRGLLDRDVDLVGVLVAGTGSDLGCDLL